MKLPSPYISLLRVSPDRIIIPPPEERIDVVSLPKAILFVLAEWSGASQLSFRVLNEVLGEFPDSSENPPIYVLDADNTATQEFLKSVGQRANGYGETFWILKGAIIGSLSSCTEKLKDTMRELTRRLLNEC
jgi:hypothetical protein